MKLLRVFISSVQKELEPERLTLFALLTTNPVLKQHVEPVLFENLPPPSRPGKKPYLDTLKTCQVYILMIDREYAPEKVKKSPSHDEYEMARSMGIPSLTMVKRENDASRDPRVQAFLNQIQDDGFTYKRFIDRIDLQKEVAAWLVQLLKDEWGIVSGHHEEESGEETIEAASTFEAGQQNILTQDNLHL